MTDIVPLFKALADEKRIKIVAVLADRELSVDQLAREVRLPAPGVVRHLAVLQEVGLVTSISRKGATLYRFSQQPLQDALRALAVEPARDGFAGDLDGFDQKVLGTFMEDGRLKSIPAQQKKRDVILRYLAAQFEPDRMYEEREVNDLLGRYHEDVASLRRYLVDTNLLERQIVRVVEAESLFAGTPEVEYRITYWKPGAGSDGPHD